MNLWEDAKGLIQVELTSAEGAQTLTAVIGRDIPVTHVEISGDLTVCFWIRRQDLPPLSSLCQKRGDSLRILKKRGLYWMGTGLIKRPVLIFGLLFLMLLGLYLPSRVLFFQVEGNVRIPARQILEAAEECGVGFGASRRYVRSEKVKNALLGAIPELSWAGVNTSGCTAVISVRERQQWSEEPAAGTRVVAGRDGFVLSCDVTQGTALTGPGQTVRKGQTLISGYTDCGICIRATGAEGEIFARTKRELDAVSPVNWLCPGERGQVKRKYSLIFRKKRINLWKDSGICDTTCGRIYKEYPLTLPGGFRLPLSLVVEEFTFRELTNVELDQAQAEEALGAFAERYLREQMVSGEIVQRDQAVTMEDGVCRLTGTYDCTEMIGRVSAEQIGETNGKRD